VNGNDQKVAHHFDALGDAVALHRAVVRLQAGFGRDAAAIMAERHAYLAAKVPDNCRQEVAIQAGAASMDNAQTHSDLVPEVEQLRQTVANLRIALTTNRQISAAVGIIMARQAVTYEAAFRCLVKISQITRRKLAEVASDIVYTGALPAGAPVPD
jgi:hypothetical protein